MKHSLCFFLYNQMLFFLLFSLSESLLFSVEPFNQKKESVSGNDTLSFWLSIFEELILLLLGT